MEVSSLHTENKILKERLNRAQGNWFTLLIDKPEKILVSIHCNHHVLNLLITTSVTVENLEEKLSSNREEVDGVYHTLQQQQMEAERKASDEKSEEHSHLQSQIEKLYQENYQLKSEVSPYIWSLKVVEELQ